MGLYKIDFKFANAEMIAGKKPYIIFHCGWDEKFEATNATEAIFKALQYWYDEIETPYKNIDTKNMELNIYDGKPNNGGKNIERYWGFTAEEVDENGTNIEDARALQALQVI